MQQQWFAFASVKRTIILHNKITRLREKWAKTAGVLIQHGADLTEALPKIISHKAGTDLNEYCFADLVNQMISTSTHRARNVALISAIQNIDAEITTSLLQHGADVSPPAHTQCTPLAHAQVAYTRALWDQTDQTKQERMVSIIATMLDHKADTNVKNSAQHPIIALDCFRCSRVV